MFGIFLSFLSRLFALSSSIETRDFKDSSHEIPYLAIRIRYENRFTRINIFLAPSFSRFLQDVYLDNL